MNYTLPADKRTTQVQTKTEMNSPLSAEQTAQRNIRAEWFDLFQETEEYATIRTQLGTALSNL